MRVLFFFICLVFFGCNSKTEADTINLNISEENLAKVNRVIDDYLKDTLYGNINYYNSKIIKVDSVFIYSNEDSINSVLNCIDSIESEFYSIYDAIEDQ